MVGDAACARRSARGAHDDAALAPIVAIDELKRTRDATAAARIIREHRLPRECVPPQLLELPPIWDVLLETMSIADVLRDLATMTRLGLASRIAAQLADRDRLRESRVHPIAFLTALATRGCSKAIADTLDAAFYASIELVEPVGRRMMIALDVSSFAAEAAAMALVAAATERDATIVGFSGTDGITPLSIAPHHRRDAVVAEVAHDPNGGTDCALPMIWAQRHRIDVDTFCIYTDHETCIGNVQPAQALRAYRDARGIPARLVVVGMTSPGLSVADPDDAGMIDVVGFDASAPPVIADFARA